MNDNRSQLAFSFAENSEKESPSFTEAMDEYYDELHLQFLAGMIQLHQCWEALLPRREK